MKYTQTIFLFPVLIILLIACNPTQVEEAQIVLVSPTTIATIEKTATAQPSPTQIASPTSTVPVKATATHQTETDKTSTPTLIPTLTPQFIEIAPPSAITYVSECEVWRKDTDDLVTQLTDTAGGVSGFVTSETTSALAYLVEGEMYKDPQAFIYLKESEDDSPEQILDSFKFEAPYDEDEGPLLIWETAFSPDGNLLAISIMRGIWLYDLNTEEFFHVYEQEVPADFEYSKSLRFSPDSKWLLSTVQTTSIRYEKLLNLETSESFDLPGYAGDWGRYVRTIDWSGDRQVERLRVDSDEGGTFIEAFVDTYTIPAMQKISSFQVGLRSYTDDSVVEDYVVTTEEIENEETLTTHWIDDSNLLSGVDVDGTVYILMPRYDAEDNAYMTLLAWEKDSGNWRMLYKNPNVKLHDGPFSTMGTLHIHMQDDGVPVFYLDTPGDIFYLNLQTQSPELVASNASFHSSSKYIHQQDCP